MICTKCPYNGTGSEECLKCHQDEQYSYKYQQYIYETYDAPQPEKNSSDKCTHLSEDDEDMLRKALYALFDLSPMELLTLQGIMRNKSLQQIADDCTKLFKKNDKTCTRHHIFQLRKSIINKLPEFQSALITMGQRKELKP